MARPHCGYTRWRTRCVNGAPLTTNVENLAIWELADTLESELMEIEEGAKRAMKLLRPLLKLAPDEYGRAVTLRTAHRRVLR
jgi:hypothetical protein